MSNDKILKDLFKFPSIEQCGQTFNQRYEEAIKDLSEDDIMFLTDLKKKVLIEWVNAPERVRLVLLKKWKTHGIPKDVVTKMWDFFAAEPDGPYEGSITMLKKTILKLFGK